MKDVRVPEQLQRAMAAEAEAAREARAKVIAAEGEHKASRALRHAAEVITDSPAALQVLGTQSSHHFPNIIFALISCATSRPSTVPAGEQEDTVHTPSPSICITDDPVT